MPNPRIPENIVVHLGAPDSDAMNVTESFADYIKNVASSEIFPTWPEQALRANILAQISVALNRVYEVIVDKCTKLWNKLLLVTTVIAVIILILFWN